MKIFREVLVYLIRDNQILLIKKKRGFGKEFINAPGGKVEENELPEEAAIRETFEETGIKIKELEFYGLLEFREKREEIHYVYIFVSKNFEGDEKESEEAVPFWCKIEKIPFESMWESDKYWLPLILKGKKIFGIVNFENWKLKDFKIYSLKLENFFS